MKVVGLNHYNLRASRELLETLRAFYIDIMGLAAGYRPPFASHGYWLYAGEQAVLHLSEAIDGEQRGIDIVTTFDHVAFNCIGRRQFEKKLAERNINYEIGQVPDTGQVQIFFSDPAGNGIELSFANADT